MEKYYKNYILPFTPEIKAREMRYRNAIVNAQKQVNEKYNYNYLCMTKRIDHFQIDFTSTNPPNRWNIENTIWQYISGQIERYPTCNYHATIVTYHYVSAIIAALNAEFGYQMEDIPLHWKSDWCLYRNDTKVPNKLHPDQFITYDSADVVEKNDMLFAHDIPIDNSSLL